MRSTLSRILALLPVAAPVVAGAATISKANNAFDLNLGSCWFGNVAPGANDIASFDFYPSTQSRSPMASDLVWGGISVANTSTWGCRFGPSIGTSYYQLSLGASGINAQGATTQNKSITMLCELLLTADQTWTSATAANISLLGTYRPTGSYVDLGGRTLTISGIATSFSGNNPAPFEVKNGTIHLTNGSSLRISSGTRPTGDGVDPDCDVPASLTLHVNAGSEVTPYNNPRSTENLHWNANLVLNGGKLHASGFQGYFAGSADSTNNTLGGTVLVTAASSIELSPEITFQFEDPPVDVLHKITAPITGSTSLSLKNASKTAAHNLIVLSGDNSGFTGAVGIVADTSDGLTSGRVRLASDNAGSPGPWSIASGNTLEIHNSTVSLGNLTGPGTVKATGGVSTLGVTGGNFQGTVTQEAGSVMHLRKTGTATHSQLGTIAWNGNTTVAGGKLSLSKATLDDGSDVKIENAAILRLTHGAVDQVARLFIDNVEQAGGTWGAAGSGADHESPLFESSGMLQVGPPAPFVTWINSFAAITLPADREPAANPDGDGSDNFTEFAFAGDPASGANSGFVRQETAATLRLIVAMREGADFDDNGGELLSSAVDGVIYHVQASTDLTDFLGETVGEIPGFTAPGTLPALPDGWEYRGFETSKSVASDSQQFLRVVADPAP